MIKNERQYRITKALADRFVRGIADAVAQPNAVVHPRLRKAELDGMRSQLEELRAALREYKSLRSGKRRVLPLGSIEELSTTLIQARIAAGLTQEELAARLGLKPQQVQRYEATSYRSASLQRVNEVVRALGVTLRRPTEIRLAS